MGATMAASTVRTDTRTRFLEIMDEIAQRGAQAMVAGCTEIGMLINGEHTDVTLFDTTRIHAEEAVALALE